jgi:hypothetical protein
LGKEIKIVYTRNGYQGALQFAEGAPQPLMIVDIKVDGTKISFAMPNGPSGGKFSGTFASGVLKGEFQFSEGGSEQVELHKGKSYWD